MPNLFNLYETITNSLEYDFLYIISVVAVLCGILIIISKNPIVSVLFLIGLFVSIAGYLMMLGINFIGLSYLLVYVGAVSILFLFILMLINVRISELVTNSSNSIPLAIMIGIFFYIAQAYPYKVAVNVSGMGFYLVTRTYISDYINYVSGWIFSYADRLFFASSHSWDGRLAETSHITSIGNIIYTNYPLWLILTSLILLLAMVGCIVITIKQ